MNTYTQRYNLIMLDFETRFKLKRALKEFNDGDPVDALKDAKLLYELMMQRVKEETK